MWTVESRARHDRSQLRYPSDLADEEWALARPEIRRAKRGGNKRTVDVREVMERAMYVLSTGCRWRAIPKGLPPRSTVDFHFCRWQHDGTLDRLRHALYVRCRELGVSRSESAWADRAACPTAAIIDMPLSAEGDQASRALKKGAPDRSAGLRWRQEDQGQEAACPRRYARPADGGDRPRGRHPGS